MQQRRVGANQGAPRATTMLARTPGGTGPPVPASRRAPASRGTPGRPGGRVPRPRWAPSGPQPRRWCSAPRAPAVPA